MKNEKESAIEAAIETTRAQAAQIQVLVDAYAAMGQATAELLRSAAVRISSATPRALKPPPPVSTHLRRFAKALADKVSATITLLTGEQRTRLGALVAPFTSAALANEPDVFVMVVRWLDLAPEDLAHELVAGIDALERRFAS